ncbi:MAG: PAS domain S-box protein, partial [Bacteroidetes bacterium]|nr:PAS domain S-box protein [Bacteroidota bacterium]
DLILMDINLGPGIDGTVAAQEILKTKDIPILFLSSHTEKEIVELTEKITSYGYVVKNTGPVVLAVSIKMAFKLFEANKEISFSANSLIQSESQFAAVYEKSPIGIVQVNLQGKIINANPTFVRILGYSKNELLQLKWKDFTHPDDLEMNSELYVDVISGKRDSYSIEKRYVKNDNEIVWVSLSVVSVKNSDGKPMFLLGMVEDISERINIEKLKKDEITYLNSINQLAIKLAPFSHKDDLYNIISKSLMKISGAEIVTLSIYNPEQKEIKIERIEAKSHLVNIANRYLGTNILNLRFKVSDEDYQTMLSEVVGFKNSLSETSFGSISPTIGNAIQKMTSIDKFAGVAYIIDGKLFGTSILGFKKEVPFPSEELLKSYAHIIALSIQRKTLEDKFYHVDKGMRLSEEKFSKIFRISPDAIILSRLTDGVMVEVNDSFTKMTGFAKEEVIGKSSSSEMIGLWLDFNQRENFVNELLKNNEISGFEVKLKKKDGSIINGLRSAKIIEINGESHILSITHEITDRKKIEESLLKSEAKFKTFFNNIHDAYYHVDVNYLISEISPSIERISGYSREELIGKPVQSFYENANDRDLFLMEISKNGFVKDYEVKLISKNGESKWVSLNANLVPSSDNKLRYIEGFITEINDRKKLELSLRKMAHAVEQSPASIVVTDVDGNIEYVNPKFTEVSGYSEKEVLGKNPRILGSGLTPRMVYCELWETLKAGFEWKGEFSNRKKNGDIYIESASISPIIDEFGKITNFVAVKEDITERKLAENILEEKEEFYHAIFDRSGAIKLLIDPVTFKIIDGNPAAEEYYGYSHDQLIDLKIIDINILDPEKIAEEMQKAISGEKRYFNFKHKLANGEIREVEVYSSKIVLRGKPLLYSLIHDITERKFAELQIKKYADELKTAVATKDKFFSIIAHDLKSPFNAIIGFSDLMEMDYKNKDFSNFELYLDSISKSSKSAFNLLETLLEWAMTQSRRIKYLPKRINLSSKIKENTEFAEMQASKKNIDLSINIQNDLFVFADKYMLNAILRNLISNAIKYTYQKGSVIISAIPKNSFVQVAVKDTGIGIPKKFIDQLFKIEKKSSTPGTEKETGTGLGLILCKEFVESNGGEIWVETEEGKGSTFFFTLPVA